MLPFSLATISRRKLIKISILSTVGVLLAACATQTTPTPAAPTQAPAPAVPTNTPAPAATSAVAAPTNTPAPAATATTAAANTPVAAQATTAPKTAALTGTITLLVDTTYGVVDPSGMTPITKEIRALFDKYQKSVQPGVKIQLEDMPVPQGEVYYDLLRTRAEAGNISDLVAFEPRPTIENPTLFYQIPRDLLNKPNPYSTNKTWWDDFPYNGVSFGGYTGAQPNTYWSVSMTVSGGGGALGIGYNRDLFAKAGIGPVPPQSWSDFMDWHKKLKSIGVIPWDTGMGGSGNAWYHGMIYDNLIEAHHAELDQMSGAFFGEKPSGMFNPEQVVYLLKTNKWRLDDAFSTAYFDILKDWSQYWQPGYLASSVKSYFLTGEAAMTFALIEDVYKWETDLQGQFKWGTFTWPSITSTTSPQAPGLPQRPAGATGQAGSYSRGAIFMIPQKTVQAGRLPLVLDLLQWLTAPAQLQEFGKTIEPRSAAPGALVKDVYSDDPEGQEHWRFHYEPTDIVNGQRYGWDEWWNLAGPGLEVPFRQNNTSWLAGQIATSKDAAASLQSLAMAAVDRWIAQNPDQKPAPATWT